MGEPFSLSSVDNPDLKQQVGAESVPHCADDRPTDVGAVPCSLAACPGMFEQKSAFSHCSLNLSRRFRLSNMSQTFFFFFFTFLFIFLKNAQLVHNNLRIVYMYLNPNSFIIDPKE